METYNMSTDIDLYSTIYSVNSENACSNGVSEMNLMDEAHFDIPSYPSIESPWYSGSSEHLNAMDGFSGESVNFPTNMISAPEYSVCSKSAFGAYIKADSNAAVDSFKTSQVLHKSCFRFLRKIEQQRKLAGQLSSLITVRTDGEDQQPKSGFPMILGFQHKIAERNRRRKLRQLFVNLHSFLPRNSKKDKQSILANATNYLNQLKLRVAELEQQNKSLQNFLLPTNISNKEGSSRFESQEMLLISDATVYCSDEVALEQSKDIPCQVNIRISVQKRVVSCPTSVFISALECLRKEELQVLSFQSEREPFRFHANILVRPKVCVGPVILNLHCFQNYLTRFHNPCCIFVSKMYGIVEDLRECFLWNVKDGQGWDICKWQTLGTLLRRSLQ